MLRHLEAHFVGTAEYEGKFTDIGAARRERDMKLSTKCFTAGLLLISMASTASAQTYSWSYGDYGPRWKGYYGTPYDGGPQYGSGGGDQYGYGPGYSYARQAPSRYHWR
jgi:hypothetical protein